VNGCKSETHKRRCPLDPAGTSWAGWGFRLADFESHGETETRSYTADEAADLARTPVALATNTVFDLTPTSMNNPAMDAATLNAHLAEGIPALSGAAGLTAFSAKLMRSFDMDAQGKPEGGAWGRSSEPYTTRWLHSDMRNMSFFYTHLLFEELVKVGEMK
jgi:hypothetical protein